MALRFKCQDCEADIIVEDAKVGETAVCSSCGKHNVVTEMAVEVSADECSHCRENKIAPKEETELSIPSAGTKSANHRKSEEERRARMKQTEQNELRP